MYILHAAHSASGRNLVSRIFAAIFEIKNFLSNKSKKRYWKCYKYNVVLTDDSNPEKLTLKRWRHHEPNYICRTGVERFKKRKSYLEKRRSGQQQRGAARVKALYPLPPLRNGNSIKYIPNLKPSAGSATYLCFHINSVL